MATDFMTTDLIVAIGTTSSAAIVVWALATAIPVASARRAAFAAVLVVWFTAVVVLGATGALTPQRLGTPGVGAAVALPVLIAVILAPRWRPLRDALIGISVPVLVGVNVVRVFGFFFVIHYWQGRLPAPFAPVAGWGDVLIGIAALPVAGMILHQARGWRGAALVWNSLGLADLVAAVALGVASAYDSPFRLFTTGPDTATMSLLPMLLIPGFLVPILTLTHLAVFYRLAALRRVGLADA